MRHVCGAKFKIQVKSNWIFSEVWLLIYRYIDYQIILKK